MDENTQSTTSTGIQDYYNLIKAEHEANNAWSAEQAQKAMDYQTHMSNTAHQREVADLKAAGLNPVLSAGGSGATSGSGMAAQRGDENVTALYGLTKTALDATMKQASAMNNIARAYGSGISSSLGSSDSSDTEVLDLASDVAYRLFGLRLDHLKAWLKSIGISSDSDLSKYIGVHTTKTFEPVLSNREGISKKLQEFADIVNNKPKVVYSGRPVHVTGSAKGLKTSNSLPSKIVSSIIDFARRNSTRS